MEDGRGRDLVVTELTCFEQGLSGTKIQRQSERQT